MSATLAASDRRGFLRQLAGLTVAAPAATLPVLAAASPIGEDPALLSLARDLDRAEARARDAAARLAAAEAIYDARKADVPADLVFDRWSPECRILEAKTETRYNGKLAEPTARGRLIVEAAKLRELVAQADGRTRFGRRVRRMLKVAESYEADLAALEHRLDLPDLTAEQSKADRDQHLVVERIVKTEACTMAGLALKARAPARHGRQRLQHGHGLLLGQGLRRERRRCGGSASGDLCASRQAGGDPCLITSDACCSLDSGRLVRSGGRRSAPIPTRRRAEVHALAALRHPPPPLT